MGEGFSDEVLGGLRLFGGSDSVEGLEGFGVGGLGAKGSLPLRRLYPSFQ